MSSIKYIAVIVALFMILYAWNVQTATLLAGAGIIGLAVSFGAQSLIEDIFAGLFIIFEKQFVVGDVIQIEDFRGVVKEVGLRITKFEDINGDIKIINNSDIRGAINSSSVLSQAVSLIQISYKQDVLKFETLMKEHLKDIKELVPQIKKGPFYEGIETFDSSGVTVRIVCWTNEIDRFRTIREVNKQLKVLFDKHNIEIPYPQIVVHQENK
jgi:small conductance mechanosensitive channel